MGKASHDWVSTTLPRARRGLLDGRNSSQLAESNAMRATPNMVTGGGGNMKKTKTHEVGASVLFSERNRGGMSEVGDLSDLSRFTVAKNARGIFLSDKASKIVPAPDSRRSGTFESHKRLRCRKS